MLSIFKDTQYGVLLKIRHIIQNGIASYTYLLVFIYSDPHGINQCEEGDDVQADIVKKDEDYKYD